MPTLASLDRGDQNQIVGKQKKSWVQGYRRAKPDPQALRPYTLRVLRDHGGGLWTFEGDDGQLYLGVHSRENTAHLRDVSANRDTHFADAHEYWQKVARPPA